MAEDTKIIRIVVDSSAAIDGSRKATDALARMEKSLDQSKTALERMEGGLGKIGTLLKANLALAMAEIGARLGEMGRQAFEAAAGLDELAEQLGTNARALQGFQYQAAQYGVKTEQLETALSKFSQKMGEAADGSKDMVDALNALGVKNLDFQGKLRPTEALMQDVAAAIVAIEDPAKRSATAVDFFGKAGARMLPMLGEVAKGADNLAASAERAGAMISSETIARLDKVSDRMEANKLKWRAQAAEVLGTLAEASDGFNKWFNESAAGTEAWLKRQADALNGWAMDLQETIATAGARASAMFLEAFRAMPDQLGKLFTDALNKAIEAVSLGRVSGGGASFGGYTGQISASGDAAAGEMAGVFGARRAAMARQALLNRQAGMESDETAARVGKLGVVYAPGASTSAAKGAGGAEADAIAKARRSAKLDVDAQTALAEASERGSRAVADLETHFKALKAAQDAYGQTTDQNTAGVAALTSELERLMAAADKAKAIKDFNLGTEGLEKTNELLEAENRLINASAEDRARELALIRTKQEVLSKGLDESNGKEREAIERRQAAIEQNERLKAQGEELKRSNEIWTAPLKSALESIQRTGADMWEQLLENGKFSAEEFGQIFAKMARRAAAELLALATIRPVINVAMQGLGSLGLVSPGTASALGYPGSAGAGGSIGGLGGGSLFGSGGLFGSTNNGWLGNIGSWLNSPIGGSWSGISNLPAGMYGPAPNTAGGLGLSGTTWGQGLGALAGAGMGIYSLATANGNTGKTIGGIASLVGAGVSLIPGVGQIAGPIIGMLGGLLPGLFGGGQQEPPTMRGIGTLDFSGGAFRTTGSGYGGGQAIDLGPVGKSMTGLLQGAGVNLGALTGAYGIQQQNYSKGDFSNSTVFVNGKQWGQGSNERDIGLDSAVATVAHSMMMEVSSGISQTMREGLAGFGQANLNTVISTQDLAKAVSEIRDFEAAMKSLSATTSSAEQALAQIDAQFAGLYDTANRYGIGTGQIDVAKAKARTKLGTDFADSISRQLMGDKEGSLFDLDKERKDLLEANAAYRAIVGYADQAAKIEELYAKKRAAIIEQYAKQSTDALQAIIDRLTYGDLANASPTTSYSGQRATYLATLAQSRAGDAAASGRLSGVAEAYANAGRSYFGSSAEYAAIAEQIRRDLIERQAAANAGSDPTGQAAQIAALTQLVQQQTQLAAANQQDSQALREQVSALVAQLARR